MGNLKIIRGAFDSRLELEHASVAAGFPSPADDYMHDTLDFNRDYIRHPEASFYGDVLGDSMIDAGILDGDRVIIDRAVEAQDVSRTITAPPVIAHSATSGQVVQSMEAQVVAFAAYAETMQRLQKRLDEPFVTVNTVTGDAGIKKAQDDYERLMRNKSPRKR